MHSIFGFTNSSSWKEQLDKRKENFARIDNQIKGTLENLPPSRKRHAEKNTDGDRHQPRFRPTDLSKSCGLLTGNASVSEGTAESCCSSRRAAPDWPRSSARFVLLRMLKASSMVCCQISESPAGNHIA